MRIFIGIMVALILLLAIDSYLLGGKYISMRCAARKLTGMIYTSPLAVCASKLNVGSSVAPKCDDDDPPKHSVINGIDFVGICSP